MTSLSQENPATLAPFYPLVAPSHRLPVQRSSSEKYAVPLGHPDPYLLLAQYLPLVRRICDRFKDCGEPVDDLALVGLGGLLEAVVEYEPMSNRGFVAVAVPLIVGAILDYFKDRGWAVRTPGQLVTQKAVVDRVLKSFNHSPNRPPTISEIVDATGLSTEMVLQTMENPPG